MHYPIASFPDRLVLHTEEDLLTLCVKDGEALLREIKRSAWVDPSESPFGIIEFDLLAGPCEVNGEALRNALLEGDTLSSALRDVIEGDAGALEQAIDALDVSQVLTASKPCDVVQWAWSNISAGDNAALLEAFGLDWASTDEAIHAQVKGAHSNMLRNGLTPVGNLFGQLERARQARRTQFRERVLGIAREAAESFIGDACEDWDSAQAARLGPGETWMGRAIEAGDWEGYLEDSELPAVSEGEDPFVGELRALFGSTFEDAAEKEACEARSRMDTRDAMLREEARTRSRICPIRPALHDGTPATCVMGDCMAWQSFSTSERLQTEGCTLMLAPLMVKGRLVV